MDPKRLIIMSTLAFTIAFGMWSDEKSAAAAGLAPKPDVRPPLAKNASSQEDRFLQALGAPSDEAIQEALYNGKSLADIAVNNEVDVQSIIDLQVAELTSQLDERLSSGSLALHEYESHKSELTEIITRSVYG
ncbi:hypothetical protein [Paenibacillus spongiae]|uniref:Uncharacterized protein n=1 Tax=Paenibacillus spongiae TaxID=2909671 RepID=A0ABY5SAI8_9BACL|nr:hypothetical protein [Paenibacillus spongiae]UVI30754.1 hypothetical protein L1F29_02410 [Paenibacillus spongiae]